MKPSLFGRKKVREEGRKGGNEGHRRREGKEKKRWKKKVENKKILNSLYG
jgi:hypothetical protein